MNATRNCPNHPDRKPMARGLCQPCYRKALRADLQPELPITKHSVSDVDPELSVGVCVICVPTRVRIRGGGRGVECRTVRMRHRKTRKETKYVHRYGMTRAEHEKLIEEADGLCAICKQPDLLVIDHCHATGRVRGLLCMKCNVALGFMKDDPTRLRAAADYLLKGA